MKLGKKLVAVLLLVVMVVSLAACSSSSIVGKWKMDIKSVLTMSGMSEAEYEQMKPLIGDMSATMEFTEDGKVYLVVTAMGQSETEEQTYSVDGDRITILEAIAKAGDLSKEARLDRVCVIRTVDGKQEIYYNDIRTADIFMSPTYYLQQNDIVYVEPKHKPRNENAWQTATFTVSLLSLFSSIVWALSAVGIIGG